MNEIRRIQSMIDDVEKRYFYSMRTLEDRIDRDEWMDILEVQKAKAIRDAKARQEAINSRRRELRLI